MSGEQTLPPTWIRSSLGEVATTQLGKSMDPRDKNGPRQRPYLRNANVQWDSLRLDDVATMHFSESDSAKYRLAPGDLLVCEGGDVGRAAIWRGEIADCHFQNALHRVRPRDGRVSAEWLLETLRLLTASGQIAQYAQGNTILHLSQRALRSLPVVIPPPEDQRLLVDGIKSCTDKRRSAQRHLAASRSVIERFRQAVLAAACSGRLTADWRETRDPSVSPDLTHSLTLAEDDPVDLPPSWVRARVGDIGQIQVGGTPSRKVATYWAGGVPWVSSGEVANCRINTTRETISEDGLANSSAKLYPRGTVLIAMIGEGKTRGQAAILDIQASTNQNVAGIIPDRRYAAPEYLWRWALAEYEITRAVGRGGNQPALNKQKVRELVVPIPPLAEQEEIVRRVDRLLALADNLNRRIDAAGRRVAKTSQAILAKAFRGELIGTAAQGD